MNILIIDNSIAFTGAFKCALNEAELLSDEHQFVFIVPKGSKVIPILRIKGYKVYDLPLKEISKSASVVMQYPFFLFSNLWQIRKIVKKEKINTVQVNDFYNLLGVGLKLSGFRGTLLTYVRFLPEVIPDVLRKLWLGAAYQFADKIIAVSDAVLRQLPENEKNIRIYDAVQLAERHQHARKYNEEEVVLIYLANFIRGKGQEYALEAFSIAYQSNNNLRLKFIGGDMGLEKNVAFREELITKTNKLGLQQVVSFEGFTEDVELEIKQADILLNFSDAESFSMTCLEASFYGTPVIATRCGGPEEIVQHEVTGLLVTKKNISEMADAINRLSLNEELRDKFATAGKGYVREKFSTDNFKKTFTAIIE